MVNTEGNLFAFPATQWPRPPAVKGMREEEMLPALVAEFNIIEKEWLDSYSYNSLIHLLASIPIDAEHPIMNCVCFGTGTPSGMRQGWAFEDDGLNGIDANAGQKTALYEIAIFKSVADGLGVRPDAFAQEPTYNRLDVEFLDALGITVKDVNSGFELINNRSLVYLPDAEYRGAIEVKKFDPFTYLSTGQSEKKTERRDSYWESCGFTSGLEHEGLTGSDVAARIDEQFQNTRDWWQAGEFKTPRLRKSESVFDNAWLATRLESEVTRVKYSRVPVFVKGW